MVMNDDRLGYCAACYTPSNPVCTREWMICVCRRTGKQRWSKNDSLQQDLGTIGDKDVWKNMLVAHMVSAMRRLQCGV